MPISKCRVCQHKFFEEPLLQYRNMPKAAQFLPNADDLTSERGVDLDVYQCSGCGVVQLSNDPVPYYKEVIRAAAISEEMQEFRQRQFSEFVQKYSLKDKKIIEVGCGRGEFLEVMQRCEVDAYGIEFSSDAVEHCKKADLNVSKGFIENENERLADGPFDAFFILNFLEHVPNVTGLLHGVASNLSEGGVGLIEVPNFNMILKKNLFSEFIGDHLFYFTKESLEVTLRQNGFEILECSEVWHDYIISAVVRKRKKTELSHFYNYQEKLKSEISEYIAKFDKNRVAIWGAGHQAFAVISLTELGDKIKYVVDSAPFKQGKYTPATHIPIVAPDHLNTDPIDAVIVMAASYSDEVARIIREKFDPNLSVSILRDFGLETFVK